MSTEIYKELSARMMVPDSSRMPKIWELLADEIDAALLLAMPATTAELAQKCERPLDEIEERVKGLFFKGVAFKSVKPQGAVYRIPRHLIQMHDASVQWPDAPREFYELWKGFMAEEYPPLLAMMLSAGFPAFMRVVPTSSSIENMPGVRDDENVMKIIEQTDDIAVVRCPCRLSEGNCDNEVESCIQLNRGATYNLERGTGRRITKEEAIRLVKDAQDHGLVHTLENRGGAGNVLCNCCTCCCAIIRPFLKGEPYNKILAPSRFAARVFPEECIMDGLCDDACPVGAVTLDDDADTAVVDESKCIGCGLCVDSCTTGALSLKTLRDEEFIPK